jgi:glycosyltransferase involved in cell wall biosynthesis
MKHIVILSNRASSLINFRAHTIKRLVALNYKTYVLAPDFNFKYKEQLKLLGAHPVSCPMHSVGLNPFKDFFNTIELFFILKKIKPDIFFSFTIKPVIFGNIAAFLAGIPKCISLIEGLGYVFIKNPKEGMLKVFLRFFISVLYKLALKIPKKVIFLNSADKELFVNNNLVDSYKTDILNGIGVDLNFWAPRNRIKKSITFVLVARLLYDKGIVEFVEAARIIKARFKNVNFVLVGGLDFNPSAIDKKTVLKWVDEGLIKWEGHVPSAKPILSRASVFVLPSYREGLPLSIQEAMAMGMPIITSDAPGCIDTVIHKKNGFIVPVRNPKALAAAMTHFINNPKLIKLMGDRSRRLAEKWFDINMSTDKLVNLILG